MINLKTAARRALLFFDHWHWLWLILAAPFLLFPSPIRSLALLVIPVIWIAAWLIRPNPLPFTPLNGAMLLFCVMILVSLYATYDIMVSLPRLGGVALAIGLFFAVAREAQKPAAGS